MADSKTLKIQVITKEMLENAPKFTPKTDWCECGDKETFGSYPEDGQCICGIYKHHVHCGTCGGITQIG